MSVNPLSPTYQMRAKLIQQARLQLAAYPQYDGCFDDNDLVRVKRQVQTKSGIAFTAGELAIAKPGIHFTNGNPFFTVYSVRNEVHTSVKAQDVQIVLYGAACK